jgi:methylenetetrahydrofolate dehydrogenase (NADP+)/methenyltetrahydrofolate cyclohydrolase
VVLVGNRPDSATYVRNKKKACEKVGIRSFGYDVPVDISEADLLALVAELNANPEVHGILVQFPLPDHLKEEVVMQAISPLKDVDGLHMLNVGSLAQVLTHGHPCRGHTSQPTRRIM